jgi:hypothetical protein
MLKGVNLNKVCLRLFFLPSAVIYSWQVEYRSIEHGFEADTEKFKNSRFGTMGCLFNK